MKKGYIKLYRQIQDNFVWEDKPFNQAAAWIDLMLKAGHKEQTIKYDERMLKLDRGQFLTSISKLSDEWGWSRKKTSNFIKRLEAEGMIKTEGTIKGTIKGTTKGTIISLIKYGDFQDKGTIEGTIEEHKTHTNNKYKNYKNNNIIQLKSQFIDHEPAQYDFEELENLKKK